MHPLMSESDQSPLIFISAAEPSGDKHAAHLIEATRRLSPSVRFVGVAGPKMVAAGCKSIFDMTSHAAMLLGAAKSIGRAITMLSTSSRYLRRFPFDAAVAVDSPTVHLPLAGMAQEAGIPVLYYIAPQMWAWGKHRIYKLRHRVEQVAAILPFEEKFFRDQGIDATYVGHPLASQVAREQVNRDTVSTLRSKGSPFVALLPGSRKHVVEEVLQGQLEVAEGIARAIPSAAFGVSVAGRNVASIVHESANRAKCRVTVCEKSVGDLIESADLVLVASGTSALEVAFHRKPMIVMYNASRVFYHLFARWMIRTEYLSLPNILAQDDIVPEFMPYYNSTHPIIEKAVELLRSDEMRESVSQALSALVDPMRNRDASMETAELLLGMINRRRH